MQILAPEYPDILYSLDSPQGGENLANLNPDKTLFNHLFQYGINPKE